jgi:hypothetical protein
MMCWYTNDISYTKAFSTCLNIKRAGIFQNRWTKGCHIISKFISEVKQLLMSLRTINLPSRCDVSNTLNVSWTYFHTWEINFTYENLTHNIHL